MYICVDPRCKFDISVEYTVSQLNFFLVTTTVNPDNFPYKTDLIIIINP